jgi:7-cyano-7-deazaguanine reductase
VLIDDEDVESVGYDYNPDSLQATGDVVSEKLCSHLLKSNCPVTGQPDWATVLIDYTGPAMDRAGLLQYIVSFRQKQDFHEHCVETMFTDLMARCQPQKLSVCARYTRRGGLDINPWRSTDPEEAVGPRLIRQ